MLSALGDCVPILVQVKHESSAQVMLESFEKEIETALTEVHELWIHHSVLHLLNWSTIIILLNKILSFLATVWRYFPKKFFFV